MHTHKKIIDYKILTVNERLTKENDLQKLVKDEIAEGWTPKGNLVIDKDGNLYQVMVKLEEES